MFYRTLALVHVRSILEPARPASSVPAEAGGMEEAAKGASGPGGSGVEPATGKA